jgi:hypothetical protein
MKLDEILEAQAVFKHPSGQVETLDDYGRKLFKRGNKARKRLAKLAKRKGERLKDYES